MAVRTAAQKLAKYRSMRDFGVTAEPSGDRAKTAQGNSFVIQKHAARRLHYDFRLELDGVLLSWSVPKGPSLSTKDRRLAVRTEDHPLDYAGFEGIIPAGQYGGGTVVVWDRGTWEPEGNPREGMKKGRLTFQLHGAKLAGRWHLVRTRPNGKGEEWLLFKGKDDAADDQSHIVDERPESVISGRTVEEITKSPGAVWKSNRAQPAVKHKPAANQNELMSLVGQLPLGFKLTNLDKVLYPGQGLTKGQLIAYLAVVADWMLPHVKDRPLTLVRCPEGQGKPCFFQKHVLKGSPSPIKRVPIEEDDGDLVDYMRIEDMPGVVALAQMGTLEIHTWGSHADKPEQPDLMVLDLDPDVGLDWNEVALAAIELRGRLERIGLESWVKTTGGKGLHVVVPVQRSAKLTWDELKRFSQLLVEAMEKDAPERFTTNMAKRARKGKIFLDYLRNGRNATFISPYSPRARDGAPVAVPITWEELAKGVDPASFTTQTVPKRLAKLAADPWEGIYETKQPITAAMWKALGRKGKR